jgi:hypothetical protein
MGGNHLAAVAALLLGAGGFYFSVRQEAVRPVLLALAGPTIAIGVWLLWQGA